MLPLFHIRFDSKIISTDAIIRMTKPFKHPVVFNERVKSFEWPDAFNERVTKSFERVDVFNNRSPSRLNRLMFPTNG